MKNWKEIVTEYVSEKRSYKPYEKDLIDLFDSSFQNTMLPKESWFGFPESKSSLGLFYGRIMIAGTFKKTIEILVDADIKDFIGFPTRIVGSSRGKNQLLYWVSTDIGNLKSLVSNQLIWKHYKIATEKASHYPNIKWERQNWISGKYRLSDLFNKEKLFLDTKDYDLTFQNEVVTAKRDLRENRLKRLSKANKTLKSVETKTKTFIRNPDVVVETLLRANGKCEYCLNEAPFKRDKDGEGFLEVHHIEFLSEGGLDTVENSVALCPNCHRMAHYGKREFKKEKFKKAHNNMYK